MSFYKQPPKQMAGSTSVHTPSIQHHILMTVIHKDILCCASTAGICKCEKLISTSFTSNQTKPDLIHPQPEMHNANISKPFITNTEDTDVALTVSAVTVHKL